MHDRKGPRGGQPAQGADPQQEHKYLRAMQMVESSPEHAAAYRADWAGYLQRLGVDTAGRTGPAPTTGKKLKLSTETLRRLDLGPDRLGVTWTSTATLTLPTVPTLTTLGTLGTASFTGDGPPEMPGPIPSVFPMCQNSDIPMTMCRPSDGSMPSATVTA
jgi:hypothetical protein